MSGQGLLMRGRGAILLEPSNRQSYKSHPRPPWGVIQDTRLDDRENGRELQAGQTCAGMERLPGQERPCDPPSLGDGVLCIFVLLVGLRSLTDRGGGRNGQ